MPLVSSGDRASASVPAVQSAVDEGVTRKLFRFGRDDVRYRVRWFWRVLWRGRPIMLACLLLVMVPTLLVLQQLTPRYTASAEIMIEGPDVQNALDERPANRPWLNEPLIQTEAALLSSTALAHRAIAKLRLTEDPEFNPGLAEPKPLAQIMAWLNPMSWIPARPGGEGLEGASPAVRESVALAAVTRSFVSRLSVKVTRRSYVIAIAYTSESREKAALIANTLAELYVDDRLEANFEQAKRVTNWLRERLESLRGDLSAAETAAEEYRAAHGLRHAGEQTATLTEKQLSELNSRLIIARADLAQKQARLDQMRSLARSGGTDATSDVLQSQLIQHLREQESQLEHEMAEALKTYGDRHPRILGYRADLDQLRGKIHQETGKIGTALANDVEAASAGVHSLERELEGVRREANLGGAAEVRLNELERQAQASRAVYEGFLARFKREAEQGQIQRANARVISAAEIPNAPSYPSRKTSLPLAFLAALALGTLLVFLLDRLHSAVRSADEVEELTGVPTLAMIPLHRGKSERPADEILQRPRSSLADAFRSLRTSIDLGEDGARQRFIMVTSSMPREGKTFASLCLALLFAKQYPRVLLIDADVHRPNMFRTIGVDGDRGLVQVLTGEARADEVIQRGVAGDVDFLPAGATANPAEVIKADPMKALLEQLSGHYDRIIIDSPPVLAVTDTRVLAKLADRIIFLIKWNSTPRDAVANGMKMLIESGCPVFGAALSQVNQKKYDGYGYADYGYYYGRYREYYGEQ